MSPVLVELAAAARAALADPHSLQWNGIARVRPVAVNVDGSGVLVLLSSDQSRIVGAVPVGLGQFVGGSDNEAFGRWNSLVAWLPESGEIEMIGAHGGEIIPGRLQDHVHAIRRGLETGSPRPVQLDLDISMACASACSFCFSSGYRSGRSTGRLMSWEAIGRTITSAAELGVKVVRFDGGGDPLTSPHLVGAVELCSELRLTTALLTAGDRFDRGMFPALVAAKTYVRVSLNAGTDTTRSALHGSNGGGGSLQRVLDHVAALDEVRRCAYGPKPLSEMMLGGTSMIHPTNVAETFDIAAKARKAGMDHLSFRVILGTEHSVSFNESQLAQFSDQQARVQAELVDEDFTVFFPTRPLTDQGYVPVEYFGSCRACTHRALVEVGPDPSEPALIPCGRYRGHGYLSRIAPEQVVFELLDGGRRLDEVWMSRRMSDLVEQFPNACGDCIDKSANLMLQNLTGALTKDRHAEVFRFARVDVSGSADPN